MSLRSRLVILYTVLVGGILLIFGVAFYQVISVSLVAQIDSRLEEIYRIAFDIQNNTPRALRDFERFDNQEISTDFRIQLWDRNGKLEVAWPENTISPNPLDRLNLHANQPIFRSFYEGNDHWRVLTIPLTAGGYPAGVLQIGAILNEIDELQARLIKVLFTGLLIAMTGAAWASWFSTRAVLEPLQAVTDTALQITRADDLSRRIPSRGISENDEIGQLIAAFNQTLGRLEQLFHTQRRFLVDVGHELRTPLTVIKGNAALMRRMGCGDEESLESIESESDRLSRLVGDLLLLAQAESGKLPLAHRPVELDTIVMEGWQQMRVLARDHVSLRIAEIDQILVCGDRDRLKQVLVNLLGNAVRYTPSGGQITLTLCKVENQACLKISDTGPGISPEDLPHIFERFYRAEKARTRQRDGQGFGLGLSIAYWIVRNHAGRIEVETELGKGTTFIVWLPLASDDCQQPTN